MNQPQSSIAVGQHQQTRTGGRTIISIAEDRTQMRVRWDDGREEEVPISKPKPVPAVASTRNSPRKSKPSSRSSNGRFFTGLQDVDFPRETPGHDGVTGTHWRSSPHLGGAAAAHVDSTRCLKSWPVWHQPEVHYADALCFPGKREETNQRAYHAKFTTWTDRAEFCAGFYIERLKAGDKPSDDWNRFIAWLSGEGDAILAAIMLAHKLHMVLRGNENGDTAHNDTIQRENDSWVHTHAGVSAQIPASLAEFLTTINAGGWLGVAAVQRVPKNDAIARGAELATDIGKVFTALLPAYDAATPANL